MTPDINKILHGDPVSCKRGAPMGATSYLDAPDTPVYVQRVRFVDGDYGADGTYWGCGGDPLWCGFHPVMPNRVYARAKNRAAALVKIKAEFSEVKFINK